MRYKFWLFVIAVVTVLTLNIYYIIFLLTLVNFFEQKIHRLDFVINYSRIKEYIQTKKIIKNKYENHQSPIFAFLIPLVFSCDKDEDTAVAGIPTATGFTWRENAVVT